MQSPATNIGPQMWEMPPRHRDPDPDPAPAPSSSAPGLGYALVLSTPIAAAVIHVDWGEFGGFNVSGWMWVIFLAAAALVLVQQLLAGNRPRFPLRPWIAWLSILWLSLLWTEAARGRALQDALQITSPLVMALVGSMCVRTPAQLRMLLRLTAGMTLMLAAIFLAKKTGILVQTDDPAPYRVMSITLNLAGAVWLAGFPYRFVVPWGGWGASVALALISGSRMATMSLLVLPIFHPNVRGIFWRVLALTSAAVLAVALFYTPYLQQRFFETGSGTLADVAQGEFLTFGRFESWPDIWERAWQRPILGSGVGSTYEFVPTVWEEMRHVHNDYLRIGFEVGIVGLAAFVLALVGQGVGLRRAMRRARELNEEARVAVSVGLGASFLALVSFALIAVTDNILVYNLVFTNPWFMMMGASYGVLACHTTPAADSTQLHDHPAVP